MAPARSSRPGWWAAQPTHARFGHHRQEDRPDAAVRCQPDLYNYGATSYFQRSLKRYTGGAFVHYDLNDNGQVYSETMCANIETIAQYGPSADFFSPANVSCANPLLTAQEVSTLCNRRPTLRRTRRTPRRIG